MFVCLFELIKCLLKFKYINDHNQAFYHRTRLV
jgi:hypothetical protein